MKRPVILLTILAGLLGGATPGVAEPAHFRPRISAMRWEDPPVTTSSGECNPDGTCDEEILIVRAHDPNSSITEIDVWFSENDDAGPIVFAHTFCLQGTAPGRPAHLEIGASYSEPGSYTVAAVAYSHRRCLPHEPGDGHAMLHSRVERLETVVEEPTAFR